MNAIEWAQNSFYVLIPMITAFYILIEIANTTYSGQV
jgi:hypothetical protein